VIASAVAQVNPTALNTFLLGPHFSSFLAFSCILPGFFCFKPLVDCFEHFCVFSSYITPWLHTDFFSAALLSLASYTLSDFSSFAVFSFIQQLMRFTLICILHGMVFAKCSLFASDEAWHFHTHRCRAFSIAASLLCVACAFRAPSSLSSFEESRLQTASSTLFFFQ
jgi:hypothetical protein